jgi:hypothetical protein
MCRTTIDTYEDRQISLEVASEAEKSKNANKYLLSQFPHKSRYFLGGKPLDYASAPFMNTEPRCDVHMSFTSSLHQLSCPIIASQRAISATRPRNIEFNTPSPWDPPQEIRYRYCTRCTFSHWDIELVESYRDTESVKICAPTPMRESKSGEWTKFQFCQTRDWEEKATETSNSTMKIWRRSALEEVAHRGGVERGVLEWRSGRRLVMESNVEAELQRDPHKGQIGQMGHG